MSKPRILASLIALNTAVFAPQVIAESQDDKIAALEQEVSKLSKKFGHLEFGGRIQLDYNYFNGAYNADNQGENAQSLFPRRARVYVESEHTDWDYKLLLDFAEEAEIVMARLRYSGFGNGLKLAAGKLREDISLDALTSSKHIALIERSMLANTLSPYFRWGVAASQYFADSGLRYAVGAYKNDAFGASGENADGALELALSGRLTWADATPGKVKHAGVWYSHRAMGDSDLSSKFARGELRDTNVRLLNYASGGETVALNSMQQSGIELAWQHDALLLQAEYGQRTLDTSDPTSPLDGETYGGYYVQASYFLTGEQRSYSKGSAVFKQPKGVSNAWELAARVSSMDATSAQQGTEVQTYTLGTSYYFSPKTKVMLNLIHSKVDGPGAKALIGTETDGNAMSARLQYLF
ncbi:hypothetical protein NFHSH190041_15290 [Shewanella sp. NFH-SH190041]|uniref:OprO/OprP family phosphate-selective porin n=1 Tax=Shewanella sp. NFH-SH190041 TaxID=2950245 RepID=UPI0021C3FF63|nr:OprO/OprP family phosphate-selective porin [Shewanella sp. NFH-SH190041]BDM64077.1 hypothetical protein NFHSH190041_15290 [Shewanella sp. NFH-SH190041]